jgi:hypothetical protein
MLGEPTTPFLERVTHPAVIIYGRYDHLIPNPYLHPGWAADVFREGARRAGMAGHHVIGGNCADRLAHVAAEDANPSPVPPRSRTDSTGQHTFPTG